VLAGKCVSREMQEINREVDPFIKKKPEKASDRHFRTYLILSPVGI
jgi:hypothetical protein